MKVRGRRVGRAWLLDGYKKNIAVWGPMIQAT